ncbi:hypothetical protein DPMN_130632 [Dreissena polymorpha]|uniref:Uncharacterized protein n=1 Tax=Dreissena polymorpha TaxID=45954 RepID=A0A9D4JYK0_DREPO|nr:hypothetical protein DPMN_130632 [Dreissena polymorpha]
MENDYIKLTNKTETGQNEENGEGESQRSGQIGKDVLLEECIPVYGFDPMFLDDTLDNVTSNEEATIQIPELNEEFEDIYISTI